MLGAGRRETDSPLARPSGYSRRTMGGAAWRGDDRVEDNDMTFDYSRDFAAIDFHAHPELYQVGKGEQGVLLVEPYKSEILPLWRFRTPEAARESAGAIHDIYLRYKEAGDFPGMDMARKFLQMGYTRARRYANHRSGRKWSAGRAAVLPLDPDPVKAEAAAIFKERWRQVADDPDYRRMRAAHRQRHEGVPPP